MKKTMVFGILAFFLVAGGSLFPQFVHADVDWRVIKDLDLKATPLDVAPSADGKWLFILAPGEILIFSIPEGIITDRIPVDREFDRISPFPRADILAISSSTKKNLQIAVVQAIYKINVADLPFKGPENAPVTVIVFDDYQ